MQKHDIYEILNVLSETELISLDKYLKSPYFNSSENITTFYRCIIKHPEFPSIALNDDDLFKLIFPDEKLVKTRIAEIRRNLLVLLKQFLVVEKHKNDEFESNRILARRFKNNKTIWRKYIEENSKLVNKTQKETEFLFYQKYQIELDKHQLIENEGNRDLEPNLQNLIENLNIHYLVSALKYQYKTINFQKFKKYQYDLGFLEEVLNYSKTEKGEIAMIKIYRLLLDIAKEKKSDDSFFELKDILKKESLKLPKLELREMYSMLKNHFIKKINEGDVGFIQHLFDINKMEVDDGIIAVEGIIKSNSFKNIVTVAILADNLKWLNQFLTDYKNSVEISVHDIGLAQYKFASGEFEETLDLVQTTKYKDPLFKLNSYSLSIQSLYELANQSDSQEEYDSLLDKKIKSFDKWLKREEKKNSLPPHKVHYNDFIKLMKKLYKFHHNPDIVKNQILSLEEEIKKSKTQAKRWMIKKVKSL